MPLPLLQRAHPIAPLSGPALAARVRAGLKRRWAPPTSFLIYYWPQQAMRADRRRTGAAAASDVHAVPSLPIVGVHPGEASIRWVMSQPNKRAAGRSAFQPEPMWLSRRVGGDEAQMRGLGRASLCPCTTACNDNGDASWCYVGPECGGSIDDGIRPPGWVGGSSRSCAPASNAGPDIVRIYDALDRQLGDAARSARERRGTLGDALEGQVASWHGTLQQRRSIAQNTRYGPVADPQTLAGVNADRRAVLDLIKSIYSHLGIGPVRLAPPPPPVPLPIQLPPAPVITIPITIKSRSRTRPTPLQLPPTPVMTTSIAVKSRSRTRTRTRNMVAPQPAPARGDRSRTVRARTRARPVAWGEPSFAPASPEAWAQPPPSAPAPTPILPLSPPVQPVAWTDPGAFEQSPQQAWAQLPPTGPAPAPTLSPSGQPAAWSDSGAFQQPPSQQAWSPPPPAPVSAAWGPGSFASTFSPPPSWGSSALQPSLAWSSAPVSAPWGQGAQGAPTPWNIGPSAVAPLPPPWGQGAQGAPTPWNIGPAAVAPLPPAWGSAAVGWGGQQSMVPMGFGTDNTGYYDANYANYGIGRNDLAPTPNFIGQSASYPGPGYPGPGYPSFPQLPPSSIAAPWGPDPSEWPGR
jgi:hypothetical protein